MSARLSKLWVIWQEPEDGRRRVIGELWRDAQGFAFAYGHEVSIALRHGFRLLAEFPQQRDANEAYRSSYLFATFAQRIPSPRRLDFESIMRSWGVVHMDDPLEALACSGGIQMTDRVELAEYRPNDDDLAAPLFIRLAGKKYHPGAAQVAAGVELQLVREPEHEHDPCATAVFTPHGEKAGYVPRQYSPLTARLIDGGTPLRATAVRRLGFPADEERWVVKLERVATA